MKFEVFLARHMADPAFKEEWERLDLPFQAGNLLIKLRSDLDLTQQQLADRAGVKRSYVARIENGDANPTVKSLARILAAAGKRLVLSMEASEPGRERHESKGRRGGRRVRSEVAAQG